MADYKIVDHSDDAKDKLERNIYLTLDQVGEFIEGEARDELENAPRRVFTGILKGSISHKVQQENKQVVVGTNTEYAVYVHEGTGKYHPEGRSTPWVYYDEQRKKFFRTEGMPPNRFLKNAVDKNHNQVMEYIKNNLKKF